MDILRRVLKRGVFGQSLLALAFNVGGVLSGRLAVIFTPIFMAYPWILAIFPLVLTVRGDISGVLSGKVGTMLHTGEIRPQLRGNTRAFHSLLSSIFVLTFVDTIGVGLLSFVFNLVLQQTSSENLIYFIVIPTLTCVLSMVTAIPITLFVASKAFKSGLDPDILVYPIMSTTNDILISVIYVSIVSLILRGVVYLVFMEALIVIIALASTVLFISHIREGLFIKTLKEGLLLVLLSSVFGTINGLALKSVRRDVEKHPSILIVYPALMNTLGNIGSIIGSTETTKLALGYIKSFGQVLKDTVRSLLSVEAAAFLIHVLFGIAALAVGHVTDVAVDPFFIIKLSLFSNALSFLVISVFALTIATQTFKRGLDPDNFVIPLTTSVADTVSTLSLMTALTLLGIH
jgi:mgtE-like transporter